MMTKKQKKQTLEFSKKILEDTRPLLWIVTIGGLVLAFLCIWKDFNGALPWITTMVSLPWAAHGTIAAFYLNMTKSDHKVGGITFETAKATNFVKTGSENSPGI